MMASSIARLRKLTFRVLWRSPSIADHAPNGPHANSRSKRKSSDTRRQYWYCCDRRPRLPSLSIFLPTALNHQDKNLSKPYTAETTMFQPKIIFQQERKESITPLRSAGLFPASVAHYCKMEVLKGQIANIVLRLSRTSSLTS